MLGTALASALQRTKRDTVFVLRRVAERKFLRPELCFCFLGAFFTTKFPPVIINEWERRRGLKDETTGLGERIWKDGDAVK